MIVFALDCSLAACSVALVREDDILARVSRPIGPGEAERIVPLIAEAASAGGFALTDPDLFAVTVGPGSFTGIRVGLAAARGLALAAGKPLAGVGTLEALAASAQGVRAGRVVLAAIDARRGEVYAQAFFPDLSPLGEAICCSAVAARTLAVAGSPATEKKALSETAQGRETEGSVIVVGSGARLVCSDADPAFVAAGGDPNPDAVVVARLARERFRGTRAPLAVDPLYVRRPNLIRHAVSP